MRFTKVLPNARPPEKVNPNDPGLTIYSAEDFTVESGEVHAYRTGIIVEIPEKSIGLLLSTAGMGFKGVTVATGALSVNDMNELRVPLINSHREAWVVKAGQAVAQLVIANGMGDDEVEEVNREDLVADLAEIVAKGKAEAASRKAVEAKRKADKAVADTKKTIDGKTTDGKTTDGKPDPIVKTTPP